MELENNLVGEWKELGNDGKKDFLAIVSVLNRYYEAYPPKGEFSESHNFRVEICKLQPGEIRVYLKRFADMDYLVGVEIENGKSDTWIHVDGIKQERADLERQGKLDHPVFNIVCLTDLWEKANARFTN